MKTAKMISEDQIEIGRWKCRALLNGDYEIDGWQKAAAFTFLKQTKKPHSQPDRQAIQRLRNAWQRSLMDALTPDDMEILEDE